MKNLPNSMAGVVLLEHGGLDKLVYKNDLKTPKCKSDEVLIKVAASAVNNTDINTRVGWYSKGLIGQSNLSTNDSMGSSACDDGSWTGTPLQFPRIQGADCCGVIVAAGENVDQSRVGERVLVRPLQQPFASESSVDNYDCITFGSECDGSFAQYTTVRSSEVYCVKSELSDAELASFPCAYSTAENMIDRANVQNGETVLITGASGGVGSAALQLAKRRNAKVIAVCSKEKAAYLTELGADQIVQRGQNLKDIFATESVDVVIDLVAGKQWQELPDMLRRGGRYVVAGAIGGPIVTMDVRTLYLKDLSFLGCTYQPRKIFENLVRYIERGELKPLVAQIFPLSDIALAQQEFAAKRFVGKLVLLP